MSWTGIWRNQYGSTVEITDEQDGLIRGTFKTALQDSVFLAPSCRWLAFGSTIA